MLSHQPFRELEVTVVDKIFELGRLCGSRIKRSKSEFKLETNGDKLLIRLMLGESFSGCYLSVTKAQNRNGPGLVLETFCKAMVSGRYADEQTRLAGVVEMAAIAAEINECVRGQVFAR